MIEVEEMEQDIIFAITEKGEIMDLHNYWKDVIEQNADKLSRYFHDDAVIRWHCTNEQFNVSEYVKVNCSYPGHWCGEIERIESCGQILVTVCRVWAQQHDISFHVVSLFRIKDGLISEIDEYWGDDGQAPQWRKNMHIGRPIKNISDSVRDGGEPCLADYN